MTTGQFASVELRGDFTESLAFQLIEKLTQPIVADEQFTCIILNINSGGGSLGAAQAACDAVRMVRSDLGLPVYASVTECALSAAYYLACECDQIFATSGALVGGIGSVFRSVDVSHLMEKLGLQYVAQASGPLKDALLPVQFHAQANSDSLTSVVDDHLDQFVEQIDARREVSDDAIEVLRSGCALSARSGIKLGLVDTLGGPLIAIERIAQLLGVSMPRLVQL